MKKKTNTVLVGMSGAGKSTLGVLLAKALAKSFVDTDILIQQKAGKRLQDIIDTEGVESFMRIEEEIVSALDTENTVIATGGSVVYSEKAMRSLSRDGVCVYLHVDFEEISARLSNITTRGIVFKNAHTLREVYEERLPLYKKYADVTVTCTGNSVEESVESIIKGLGEE